ncbi:hypothetical protein F4678DRAFT_486671 [Xylaria arbuscula]|nr:hypothetical protein F4678DRAFT_486671 [Xylaria arbuscula]
MDIHDVNLLEQYKAIYDQKCGICLKIQPTLTKDLENILAYHSIKHIPVTSRVKQWDRAAKTAERRQRERLRTKELREKNSEPFASGQEVDRAIYDLLGARIALYFPNDVNRVLNILKTSGYRDLEVKRKGGMNDLQRIRKVSDKLDKNLNAQPNTDEREEEVEAARDFERAFSGYGAVHIIAKLPQRLGKRIGLPTDKWKNFMVEIQAGTVVMHAWAEVEHDIIYKELDQVESFEDVQRISDLINGVALTGEVALKQLEVVIQKEKRPRLLESMYEHTLNRALDYNQFGEWIDQYLAGRNLPTDELPVRSDWKGLEELFEVWTTHNRFDFIPLTRVVDYIDRSKKAEFDELLPLRILLQFLEDLPAMELPMYSGVEKARFSAFQAVSICQLATYFGCPRNVTPANQDTLRMSDFLDILHPIEPQCSDSQINSLINLEIKKCRTENNEEKDLRSQISILLAKHGYFAWPSHLTNQPHGQCSFTGVLAIPHNLWKLCGPTRKPSLNPLINLLFDLSPPNYKGKRKRVSNSRIFHRWPPIFLPICDDSGRWDYSYEFPKWIIGHRNDFEQELSLLPAIKPKASRNDELVKFYAYVREIIKPEFVLLEKDVVEKIKKMTTDRFIGERLGIDAAFDLRSRLYPQLSDEKEFRLWRTCSLEMIRESLSPEGFSFPTNWLRIPSGHFSRVKRRKMALEPEVTEPRDTRGARNAK